MAKKTKKQDDPMEIFKRQVASELGINLKNGNNGNLTTKEAGYIGGTMVKKMIKAQKDQLSSGFTSKKSDDDPPILT
jgi:hypothetical protein